MAPDHAAAEAYARKRGLVHLADIYRRVNQSLSAPPPSHHSGKPKILLVADQKNWCGARLSMELVSQWKEYDCTIVHIGSGERIIFDQDLYLYRNIYWMNTAPPPKWAQKRIICMLESERPLYFIEDGVKKPADFMEMFKKCGLVVAMNKHLRDKAIRLGVPNVSDITIANGVNCKEFYPAPTYPTEFTVGAAGNFSSGWYDDWKGFSRYVVPACRRAGVKLRWCGWKGKCAGTPDIPGDQVPLEKMGDWYRGLSCFISMSKSEGCSGVTFEAMASGLPVISTRVGWHGENCSDEIVWSHRPSPETPWSVEEAIDELVAKIKLLRDNPWLCRLYGRRSREFSLNWTHERIAESWRPVLSSMIEKSSQ